MSVKLVDVNSPKFKQAMLNIFLEGIQQFVDRSKNDPLNDFPEVMNRTLAAKALGLSTQQIRTREITETELKTLGRKPDYSKDIIVYKENGKNPYYLKEQIRKYRDRLLLKEGVRGHE